MLCYCVFLDLNYYIFMDPRTPWKTVTVEEWIILAKERLIDIELMCLNNLQKPQLFGLK